MAYKIKKKQDKFKKGMKALRGAFQFESIPELKKDIAEEKKHPRVIFWNIEWGKKSEDEIRDDIKELMEGIKGLRKVRGSTFIKPFKEAIIFISPKRKKRQ